MTSHVFLSLSLFSWSLSGSEQFALRYADGPQLYITEQVSFGVLLCCWTAKRGWVVIKLCSLFISQSRGEIKNGTILRLAISPVSTLFISLLLCLFYISHLICCDFKTHKHLSFTLPSVFFCMPMSQFSSQARLCSTGEHCFEKDERKLICHSWYQHLTCWGKMYDNIFSLIPPCLGCITHTSDTSRPKTVF